MSKHWLAIDSEPMKRNSTALNANSFVNQFQNNFINSVDNRQSYDKYMDYLYNAEYCNYNLEFLVFDIENATKRLNLSSTFDCDLLNVKELLIKLRIYFFCRQKFFRKNRSHVFKSLQWDIPLKVPYRSNY